MAIAGLEESPQILVASDPTQILQGAPVTGQLACHPRQRPKVVSKAGDQSLELDGKRTKECWQPMKQELGSHP